MAAGTGSENISQEVAPGLDHLLGSEIAVIGMACRFPGAEGPDQFWRNLCEGVESLTDLSDEDLRRSGVDAAQRTDPAYVCRTALIDGIEEFDARFFGYTPQEATIMDPQHRLFLECAWEVFEQAGYDPQRYPHPIGVFTGAKTNTYLFNVVAHRARFPGLDNFQIALGNDLAAMATRISYKLNLRGPSYALHTACSTSLVAVHLACQSLLLDECSMAVAGGAAINVPQRQGYTYRKGGILSPDGSSRTFDARAAGCNFGNGAGAVLLKRLDVAIAEGDPIYAVIRGSATNNDGAEKASFTAPGVEGQTDVLLEAMACAGVKADSISYLEAHGTATELGDSIEILALNQAFRASTQRTGFCAIGSVKTNIGHLETAAGIAGLIKTVLTLHHRQIPPSLHFETPNPKIDFENSPFYVNTTLAPWPSGPPGAPRRAGVSSFGIGSTNVHVILEEAPPRPPSDPTPPWQVLPLSARSETAIEVATINLGRHLRGDEELELADVAYTLQVGRREFEHRRILVCRDREDAVAALAAVDPEHSGDRSPARFDDAVAETGGRRVAFLLPGLGEHYLNMGLGLYQREPVFRATVDRCAQQLEPLLGCDLREVIYPRGTEAAEHPADADPASGGKLDLRRMLGRDADLGSPSPAAARLDRTRFVQPATFAVEYALAQLLIAWGVRPQAMIGYSLGEYVCACLAGVLSLDDALTLVARRAALIEELPAGAMLAVTLGEDELAPWLEEYSLSLAAVNGTTGCVAAGPEDAVAALAAALTAEGIVCRRLRTSHAFHSAMMAPVADELTALVRTMTLNPPEIRFLSNVTGGRIRDEEATDPLYWARHMCQPVRFAAGVGALLADGAPALVEVGPGQGLSSFTKLDSRCDKTRPVVSAMRSPYSRESDAAVLLHALGQLWLGGVAIDWRAHHGDARRRRVSLPTYPFERQRYWIDAEPEALARASAATASAPEKKPRIEQWLYRPVWNVSALPAAEGLAGDGVWLLFGDALGVGDALAAQLGERGAEVVVVGIGDAFARVDHDPGRYRLRPGKAEDYQALLAALTEHERRPTRIVHLWNVDRAPEGPGDAATFRSAQELGFYSLIALVRALGGQGRGSGPLTIDVVSSGVHPVTGDEELVSERSTLLGPCLVIPQEHPSITCRALDVDLPARAGGAEGVDAERIAERLLAEFAAPSEELVIAHRGDERWVRRFEPMAMPPAEEAFAFRQGGVYLILGGLGGIGLALAEHLVSAAQARLVLTRRSAMPAREAWDAWLAEHGDGDDDATGRAITRVRALEAAGAEVLVASADVADEAQMRAVVEQAMARFGALHGVVHLAGVLAQDSFKTVQLTGREECELHFGPKVYGLYVLERVLEGRDLDFCILYSSLSAILGGLGYVGYATANLFMDFFAHRHNRRAARTGDTLWQSVDWDSWHYQEDAGARGGLGTTLSELAMAPSEGVETLRRLLAVREPRHLVVSTGDLAPRIAQWVELRALRAATAEAAGGGATRARLRAEKLSAGDELEERIAGIWSQVLGVADPGRDENFFDLGGNSLVGMQLVAELSKELGVEVEPVALFESPTIRDMARYVRPPEDAVGAPARRQRRRTGGATEIAIIGMHGRFPGAGSIEELWQNLVDGKETITFFTDDELRAAGVDEKTLADPHYVKARPILDDVERFDAPFFGYTPREAEIMDPQHRIFLESAWAAFENAGYDVERYDGPVGVYAGASISSYMANIYSNAELVEAVGTFQTLIGNEKDSLTTKVSYKLNLRGPSLAVQTFCSTSLVAVHLACQALLNGECDMALAGGVSVIVPQLSGYRYETGGIGSSDGHVRAFDAKSSGIVFGNGLGTVVLKRLEDALADGDPIRAVIRGSALNNDGSGKAGYSATSVEGQAEVVAAALEIAGVDPETIGYMEAHGTGTPLGDPIEMAALNQAFRPHTDKKHFCPIGSVKTNVGHLDRAAGVTSLIKTVLALEHGLIPPSLHFEDPNPAIDFEDNAFYVNTELRPWPAGEVPRRAGVNSLGLGGTNAHAVLEEAPAVEPSGPGRPWQLLVLSAASEESLERATDRLAAHLGEHPEQKLADVAYTLRIGRKAMNHRRMLVVRDGDHPAAAAALAARAPQRVRSAVREPKPWPVVFLFPGLGGQHVGMARGLYESEPRFRATVDRCATLLEPELGLDLKEVLYPPQAREDEGHDSASEQPRLDLRRMLGRGGGREDEASGRLRETRIAQPALFVVEYALAQLWMSWGVRPQAMIGYSLGEYVAACVGGMLGLEDALRLVARRSRMIQELAAGAMLAVPLSEEEIAPRLGDDLSLAALNGPQQSVVAGPLDTVAELERALVGEGVACRRLETSHAFHSRMMQPIYERFLEHLRGVDFQPPAIPYLANVTGTWMRAEEVSDPSYWARHMVSPVRFSESLEVLRREGDRILLELGPGQTLGSLILQHPAWAEGERPVVLTSLGHSYESQADLAYLLTTLGKLWLTGVEVDWVAFEDGVRRLRVALPSYPFAPHSYWVESTVHGYTNVARAAARAAAESAAADTCLYLPSWQRKPSPRPLGPAALASALEPSLARWLVFAEEGPGGLGAAIAAGLRAAGRTAVTVVAGDSFAARGEDAYAVRPGAGADYEALLDALAAPPDAVVHLWSLDAGAPDGDFEAARAFGFDSLLCLAQALERSIAERRQPLALWTVSAGAYEVSGAEQLQPAGAAVLAPVKVLPREVPGIVCRSIDLGMPADEDGAQGLAERILAEIAGAGADQVVAYRGPHRWLPIPEPIDGIGEACAHRPSPLRREGVYLVTGGLNSRGFAFASYLAQHAEQARLVLIEPQALPEVPAEEIAARSLRRLETLRAHGAEVVVVAADVTDEAALRRAVEEATARFGALGGVVHAAEPEAVAAAYATIAESASACHAAAGRALLATRIEGARVLDAVLAETLDEPPEFALLVSSLASLVGGLGLINEAAAGLYLDAFAPSRNHGRGKVPWTSVNWDFWIDADDAVRVTGLGAAGSVGQQADDDAAAWQRAALDGLFGLAPTSQVIVTPRPLLADWNRIPTAVPAAAATVSTTETGGLYPRPKLSASYVAPRSETEGTIAAIWESMFGVSQIGVHDGFLELGGDSLLATRLVARMREAFDLDLPVRMFFEASTVEQLAQEVDRLRAEHESGDSAAGELPEEDVAEEDVAEVLAMLDQLSEEEAATELERRAAPSETL